MEVILWLSAKLATVPRLWVKILLDACVIAIATYFPRCLLRPGHGTLWPDPLVIRDLLGREAGCVVPPPVAGQADRAPVAPQEWRGQLVVTRSPATTPLDDTGECRLQPGIALSEEAARCS